MAFYVNQLFWEPDYKDCGAYEISLSNIFCGIRSQRMSGLSHMKDFVKGIKDLRLNAQAQTLETPEKSRPAKAVKDTFPRHAHDYKMSLPGLEISAPVETVTVPTVHELKEQTEWRFEVAFGTKIELRVRSPSWSDLLLSLYWEN